MALVTCRECSQDVSDQAATCPHCGAPKPWQAEFRGWGFEWRSRAEVGGWPLVHVAFGRGPNGRLRVARGVIAIGQFGVGLVTIAQFGVGFLFGLGQLMLGAVAVGQVAVGLVFTLGQVAAAWVAVGQVVLAEYGLGQMGYAVHFWRFESGPDPEALRFFCEAVAQLRLPFAPEVCGPIPVEAP